jgi:zinc protease
MTSNRLRRILVGAGLAVFTSLLAPPLPAIAEVFNGKSFSLANGLQVVVVSNHRVPIVTHMVYYRVGALDEPAGQSGIAHFLEHLMFKGTKTTAPGEFSAIVARNGGRENAFTTSDATSYFQSIARDRLEVVMRIEADRMTNLVLTDEIIEPERQVVLEERRSRVENEPSSQLHEEAQAALYLNHPYRKPTIGWEHEIRALTREQIVDFYGKWYAPNNAIVVMSGDITVADARTLAEKYYGVIPARPLPVRQEWREPPQRTDRRVELKHPQVRQPSWTLRYLTPSYAYGDTQHVYALQVLEEILSGSSTSRLYNSLVVEQQVAVSTGAWYRASARGPTAFGFSATPRSVDGVAAVEKAMLAEIERLLKDGVTEEEVARAIARMQANAIFARDSNRVPARTLGGALVIGRSVEDVESWPEHIGAVTAAEVARAAHAVFADRPSVTTLLLPAQET